MHYPLHDRNRRQQGHQIDHLRQQPGYEANGDQDDALGPSRNADPTLGAQCLSS